MRRSRRSSARFDVVFALEVLQLMPFRSTMESLWDLVKPGGRVVALVPNRLCPIITGVVERFHGQYQPPTPDDVRGVVSSLASLETWHFRGMTFREDQRIEPYDLTPWSTTGDWAPPSDRQPNRLLIVARKTA